MRELAGTALDAFAGARPNSRRVWQPVSQPANLISRGPVVQRIGLQFPKLTMQVRFLPGLPTILRSRSSRHFPNRHWRETSQYTQQ
jgi:hypothetical protein